MSGKEQESGVFETHSSSSFFPFFVDVSRLLFCVIGGGNVAMRRIETLAAFGARMIVVAPTDGKTKTKRLEELEQEGALVWKRKAYQREDLLYQESGRVDVVLAATDDGRLNHAIAMECRKRKIFVNQASDRQESDFYFPSVIHRGDIVVGITGNGTNHQKVRRARKYLETSLHTWECQDGASDSRKERQ